MARSHTGNLCITPQAVPAVAPLVGGQAPDFEAQAVYDQEFVTVKLSDYKVEARAGLRGKEGCEIARGTQPG